MSTSEVSLRDLDLNKKIPSYSITRGWEKDSETGEFFGNNYDRDTISKEYWENTYKVRRYLERIDKLGLLDQALESQTLFPKLIKKLHLIQTSGILHKNNYEGQSEIMSLSEDWKSEFRKPKSDVYAKLPPESLSNLMLHFDILDRHTIRGEKNNLKNFAKVSTTVEGKPVESMVDVYAPPNLFHFNSLSNEVVLATMEEAFNSGPNYQERSSIIVFLFDYILKTGKEKRPGEPYIGGHLMYPSAFYIPHYIEMMRQHFVQFGKESDTQQKKYRLADAYQAGISSQAFELVWNSEMMGIMNFFLTKKLNLKPIAHGNMDFFAFFLSQEAFEKEFDTHVNRFNE